MTKPPLQFSSGHLQLSSISPKFPPSRLVDAWFVTTHDYPAVAAGLSVDPARWREQFEELMGRIAGRFGRVEPRRRARAFVLGLLAGLRRKNCWTIAEHAGETTPDGLQHLLAGATPARPGGWRTARSRCSCPTPHRRGTR
jgi:hypothetical protein